MDKGNTLSCTIRKDKGGALLSNRGYIVTLTKPLELKYQLIFDSLPIKTLYLRENIMLKNNPLHIGINIVEELVLYAPLEIRNEFRISVDQFKHVLGLTELGDDYVRMYLSSLQDSHKG